MKGVLGLIALLPLLAPTLAQAYVRTQDAVTGVCLFWPQREVAWMLNERGAPGLSFSEVEEAVKLSFGAWEEAACSDLRFPYAGSTPRTDVGYEPKRADNVNLLVWREQGACENVVPQEDPCWADEACADGWNCWPHAAGILALTTVSFLRGTGVVLDADVEFNGAGGFSFTTADGAPCGPGDISGCVRTDVRNTATHEIGHMLGLDHAPSAAATMFWSAAAGETSKRSLDQDDLDGLCAVYRRGAPPATCTPSGRIRIDPAPGCGCGSAASEISALVALGLLARRRRKGFATRLVPNALLPDENLTLKNTHF